MFYGYENSPIIPSMNVYDTSLMQAYIAGAREQYNQARDDFKDFLKEAKDFQSPFAADTQSMYDMSRGAAEQLINHYGTDALLKSPEGRNALTRMIAGFDTGAASRYKQSAQNAEELRKNIQKMSQDGSFDNDLFEEELARYAGLPEGSKLKLQDWDTNKYGVMNLTSPSPRESLSEIFSDLNGIKPTYHEDMSKPGVYDMKAITPEDIVNGAMGMLDDKLKTSPTLRKMYGDLLDRNTAAVLQQNGGQPLSTDDYAKIQTAARRQLAEAAAQPFMFHVTKDIDRIPQKSSSGGSGGSGGSGNGNGIEVEPYDFYKNVYNQYSASFGLDFDSAKARQTELYNVSGGDSSKFMEGTLHAAPSQMFYNQVDKKRISNDGNGYRLQVNDLKRLVSGHQIAENSSRDGGNFDGGKDDTKGFINIVKKKLPKDSVNYHVYFQPDDYVSVTQTKTDKRVCRWKGTLKVAKYDPETKTWKYDHVYNVYYTMLNDRIYNRGTGQWQRPERSGEGGNIASAMAGSTGSGSTTSSKKLLVSNQSN